MKKCFYVAWLCVAMACVVFAQNAGEAKDKTTQEFYKLLDDEWEAGLRDNPVRASLLGDRRFNDKWTDASLAAFARRRASTNEALAKLGRVNRAELSDADKLNYDLFKNEYEADVREFEFGFYLAPVSHDGGIQTTDQLANSLRFQTLKDYEDWIARLDAFPMLMTQTIALLREGIKTKTLYPKIIMERVPRQIDKQIVNVADESPFFAAFKKFPNDFSERDKKRLADAGRTAITSKVVPAYKEFKTFFANEYLPASFAKVGISERANGRAAYEFLARRYTTTNLTPQAIHNKGLAEVARIRSEMERIKTSVGFQGSLQDFFKYLRTDAKFYYKSSDELLTAYRAMAKRIDPEMVKLFKILPRAPYGVVPIPETTAPDTTTAYYMRPAADGSRPGSYYVNLYKPETRPKYEMMALSLHESVPGHHLQIALAQELGEIPNFRRYGGYTAFIEGWGLYAESLGDDVNLYDDSYSKFGQLTYEMWRAVRLVVDTGMHYFDWDRQKAIDFFLANAAKTELDVVNEIDRYIGNPGQALAYKIGELKIKELRAKAKRELGDKFDIRDFHDAVLRNGALPLSILESKMDEYIAAQKRGVRID